MRSSFGGIGRDILIRVSVQSQLHLLTRSIPIAHHPLALLLLLLAMVVKR